MKLIHCLFAWFWHNRVHGWWTCNYCIKLRLNSIQIFTCWDGQMCAHILHMTKVCLDFIKQINILCGRNRHRLAHIGPILNDWVKGNFLAFFSSNHNVESERHTFYCCFIPKQSKCLLCFVENQSSWFCVCHYLLGMQ